MMRSAGCTINDMWDKDFDIHVCWSTHFVNEYNILFANCVVVVIVIAVVQILIFEGVINDCDAIKLYAYASGLYHMLLSTQTV